VALVVLDLLERSMVSLVLASLLWSAVLIAVFAPLASILYRRRTTD
jgi:hypothetical protein